MMQQRIPLLAVDGGGTKCLALLADENGGSLGQGISGSCSAHIVGSAAATLALVQAISAAIGQWNEASDRQMIRVDADIEVDCAVFGMAGLDTEYDRTVINGMVTDALAALRIRSPRVIVENDGLAALMGATGNRPGILAISGTGSIVYGMNADGLTARAGGWGHRVGDEGSGHWIGEQAIRAIMRSYDGRGAPTLLDATIFSHFGFTEPEDLFNWTYGDAYSVDQVAGLSRYVEQAALQGDAVSIAILKEAASELFLAIQTVIRKLHMEHQPFSLILQGGVLSNCVSVQQYVCDSLKKYAPHAKLDEAISAPIYGLLAMARQRRQEHIN